MPMLRSECREHQRYGSLLGEGVNLSCVVQHGRKVNVSRHVFSKADSLSGGLYTLLLNLTMSKWAEADSLRSEQ